MKTESTRKKMNETERDEKHRECSSIEHKGGNIQDRVSKGEERKLGKKKYWVVNKNFPNLMEDFCPVNPWEYKKKKYFMSVVSQ